MRERIGVRTYRVLVGKPEVKRPLGRRGREVNIKVGLQEVDCGGAWTRLIWIRIGKGSG